MRSVGELGGEVVLVTPRLLLRRWRVSDAPLQRSLWLERDPRVPPHRRIDDSGRPTLEDLVARLRRDGPAPGLLVVERRADGAALGCCGLVDGDHGSELAYELLRAAWSSGFATEAAAAVIERTRKQGRERLHATVWDWNAASRRVLSKLGFREVGSVGPTSAHGSTLLAVLDL